MVRRWLRCKAYLGDWGSTSVELPSVTPAGNTFVGVKCSKAQMRLA